MGSRPYIIFSMKRLFEVLLLVFISIFSLSDVFADIYRCVDPETGEVVFTNFKNEIFKKNVSFI